MALDNYSNLKETIKRVDGSNSIDDILDDAIDMCESEMYGNAQMPIRHRSMEVRATDTMDGTRFLALPTNFLELRSLSLVLSGNDKDIRYATPESLQEISGNGKPTHFTITSQFVWDRVPDSTYTVEINHFAKLTALDSTNTTNDILTDCPNVYLFGSLWAVNLFNAEEDKSEFYYNKFMQAIKGCNKRYNKGRYGPVPTMKTEGTTP
jgi:alkyl hydroperoxide reductase subunit AhpF